MVRRTSLANPEERRRFPEEAEIALATKKVFNAAKADTGSDYAFEKEALLASEANASTFTCDGETYDMQILENGATEISKDGEIYATISNLLVSPQASGTFLSLEFQGSGGAGDSGKGKNLYGSR